MENMFNCCSSRLNDPARLTADRPVSTQIRFPNRPLPGKEIQMILFRVKSQESFVFSAFCASMRAEQAPALPRPMWLAPLLSVRAHVAPKRLRRIHTARRLCALRLSLPLRLAYHFSQVERGMVSGRYVYRPGGPPPNPTHALGSLPSLDRIAVSDLCNPDFSDEHEHTPLHLLDSARCSPARSLPTRLS